MPLISVIVPIYKVEPYIRRCVDSILNQTFKDFELILVDDGSPDNCPLICDEYQKKDKRITVIHKKNGGLSSAKNEGINHSKGEYISFVDGDDYICPSFLEVMVKKICKCDMIVCCYNIQKQETIIGRSIALNDSIHNNISYWSAINYNVIGVVSWNKLYKRQLFDSIEFPLNFIHEDEYVIHKIVDKCSSIVLIPDYLYNYCLRDDSIMSSNENRRYRKDWITADILYKRLCFYFEKHSIELINHYFYVYYSFLKEHMYLFFSPKIRKRIITIYMYKREYNNATIKDLFFVLFPLLYTTLLFFKKTSKL